MLGKNCIFVVKFSRWGKIFVDYFNKIKASQMLYLIESGNYYKIGYCINLKNRLITYDTNNPDYKVITTKDGNRTDEFILHKLCNKFHYRNEWFHKDPEIITVFIEYEYSTWLDRQIQDLIKQETKIRKRERYLKTYVSKNRNKLKQYDMDGNYIQTWTSQKEVQRQLGISVSTLSKCVRGYLKHAGGYKWSYD